MTGNGAPEADTEVLLALLEDAARFYAARLAGSDHAKEWMTSRGWERLAVSGPENERWRPGYAPRAWTALADHLRGLGHPDTDMVATGLGLRTSRGAAVDRFRNRLMLPLIDARGVIGFVGRALPGSGDQAPKWLNPPRTVLYDKSRHLFGLTQNADRWRSPHRPVVVEGPGDAIAVSLAGRPAVALCGTAITADHLSALDDITGGGHGLVIAFDGDTAGRDALDRAWNHLAGRAGVQVAELPDGVDPGNFATAHDQRGLQAALSNTRTIAAVVIDHRLDRWSHVLDSVGGQLEAVRDVSVLIGADPSSAAQTITHLAQRLDIPAADVSSVVLDEILRPRQIGAAAAGSSQKPAATERHTDPPMPRGRVSPRVAPVFPRSQRR